MRCILNSIGLIISLHATAQQVDWLISDPVAYSSNPAMPSECIATAPGRLVHMRALNGVYTYGQHVYGAAAFTSLDPATGAPLWSCVVADSVSINDCAVAADGKAYFAGSFMGALQLCDGSVIGGVLPAVPLQENLFIVAVDLGSGAILWARNLSWTHALANEVASLAIDPQGNLWYAVSEWGVGKVVRVNAQGNDAETRIIDGVRLFGTISFDPWGGLYVAGSVDNNGFAFGGLAYQNYGNTGYSMFVLRYKPDGTGGFARFADDITFQDPTVAATSDGHAYLAGQLLGATVWDGIAFNGPLWVHDVFVARLDSTGDFLWGIESAPPPGGLITGDFRRAKGPSICVDDQDHPRLLGTLRGSVDWGNGVISDGITLGASSIGIVAFDPDGTAQWEATSMPTGFSESQNISALSNAGVIHFAGHLAAPLTFNPHSTNAGGLQAAMVGRLDDLSTGIGERSSEAQLSAWPNPVRGTLSIQTATPQAGNVINAAGQQVRSLKLLAGMNAMDVNGFAPGLYLLRGSEGALLRFTVE